MEPEYANLVELFEQACEKFDAHELFGTKKNGRWEWLTFGQFKAEVDKCRGRMGRLRICHLFTRRDLRTDVRSTAER